MYQLVYFIWWHDPQEKNNMVGNAVTGALTYMHKYCWHLSDVREDFTGKGGTSRMDYITCPIDYDG